MAFTKVGMTTAAIDKWRNKIHVGRAIELMNRVLDGDRKIIDSLTTAQCKIIELALRKTIPDLTSVDLTTGGEAIKFTWAKADPPIVPVTVIDMIADNGAEPNSEDTKWPDKQAIEREISEIERGDMGRAGTHTSSPRKPESD
jgi:hypothetical protein